MAYKWVGVRPLRRVDGDDVAPGDVFEPTESELASFGEKLERVDPDDTPETNESDAEPDMEVDPSEMDYAELRQLAVDADTDEIDGRSKKAEIIAYFEG